MRFALVIGGARCVWSDLAQLEGHTDRFHEIIAVNKAGVDYEGHIDHWVTLHPEFLKGKWIRRRTGNNDFLTWSHKPHKVIDRVLVGDWGGSSGMFAVKVALEALRIDRVVLAGVPMDKQPHYDNEEEWWVVYNYRKAWIRKMEIIMPHVRSLSGWTREVFGGFDIDELERLGRAQVKQGEY